MILTKEHCDTIMKEAFKGRDIPKYSVEDVNRVLLECSTVVCEAVRLKVVEGKSSYEASRIMGYNSKYYAGDLYKKFLRRVRSAPSYNWYNRDELVVDKNSSIDYLELSFRANGCLRRAGIFTIGELCERTQRDIKKIRNAGPNTVEEITQKLSLLGFKLKSDPNEDLPDGLIPSDSEIKAGFSTTVIPEMLPVIYNKCMQRTKRYGYQRACISCPYRGTGEADCMFNLQPRIWVVEK